MKVAFTGKGGTGKTTLSAIFIDILARSDREVLAVDCDPDSNLGKAIEFEDADNIIPIVKMQQLIRERMSVSDNSTFFKLNPKIDDIPDSFSREKGKIKLIVMGSIRKGGGGCACPENAFVKNLIEHLVLKRGEDVVMDMEAGVEHFGRGTAQSCDSILIVVEASLKSIESAKRIKRLASDLGMRNIYVIANKVRTDTEIDFIKDNLEKGLEFIETIPFSKEILERDRIGGLSGINGEVVKRMERVYSFLSKRIGG